MHDFWFESTLFKVDPEETEQTNPGIYGQELAIWIKGRLVERGYPNADTNPEDSCWCVVPNPTTSLTGGMCWIRCANASADEDPMIWAASVEIDQPIFSFNFKARNKKIAALQQEATQVGQVLEQILKAEPAITLVAEPE